MNETERLRIIALLDPLNNKKFPAKNRFMRSATMVYMSDDETGAMSPIQKGQISGTVAGGVGTAMTGAAYINIEGKGLPRQWGLHEDERTEDVRAVADAVHGYGGKFVVQIAHCGGQRAANEKGGIPLSPSGKPHPGLDNTTREMTYEDIEKVRADFAAAALRSKEGGADGVEIHGAHGLLLTQFFSPIINRRTDEYGGTFENRSRIFREILSDVRNAVGEDFPIWFKLSMFEGIEGGYGEDEGLALGAELLKLGADAIEVSGGTSYAETLNKPVMLGVSAGESEAPFRDFAKKLKGAAGPEQLIVLTGGIRSLSVMAQLVDGGYCDILGLCRPFIAEPDLVNRWYEEDARPSACISCNACVKTAQKGGVDCPIIRDKHEGTWGPL